MSRMRPLIVRLRTASRHAVTGLVALPTLLAAWQSSVARVVVTPASPVAIIGEPLQLAAQAVDSAGRVVSGVTIRFQRTCCIFEGGVDEKGIVTAGAPGTLVVAVTAIVPGQKPVITLVSIPIRPGPAATISLDPAPVRLLAGQSLLLHPSVRSARNDLRAGDLIAWRSSAPAVARISPDGNLVGVAPGRAVITAASGNAREPLSVEVVPANLRSVTIAPTTPSVRTGDVVRFGLTVVDAGGGEVAGLTPTWMFAPGEGQIGTDGGFVAYQPGTYSVTALLGPKSATARVTVRPRDVRRPASIVGSLILNKYQTSEVWLHPNGTVAYLGTLDGGKVYTIDVGNPASPMIVDSVVVNARVINDVMASEDGKVLVITREGADNRKNGIALFTIDDPLHPKFAAEFTDPVTSGVHSAFINTQAKYGRFVYLTDDGSGRLVIANIDDPAHPKLVATWQVPRTETGRYLHDIDVKDGLLYASYLNDGLVILDVGNGIKGGSPSDPQFVSQFKYDLVARRRLAEAGGATVIGGTHTAWRHKNYVFIGDEIIPLPGPGQPLIPDRAWGGLQVIDVSDIFHPKSVAWYDPENGGVHNVWVVGDTLYMGAANAGFRAFDISGELKGDLRAQDREISHVNPVSPKGWKPNAAYTWGVVVKNGLAFVPDINSGLFIIRIGDARPAIP